MATEVFLIDQLPAEVITLKFKKYRIREVVNRCRFEICSADPESIQGFTYTDLLGNNQSVRRRSYAAKSTSKIPLYKKDKMKAKECAFLTINFPATRVETCGKCKNMSLHVHNKHKICHFCCPRRQQCPKCSALVGRVPVKDSYQYGCRFQLNGCRSMFDPNTKAAHEKDCIYRPYLCPERQSLRCRWEGAIEDLGDHLKYHHQKLVVESNKIELKQEVLSNMMTVKLLVCLKYAEDDLSFKPLVLYSPGTWSFIVHCNDSYFIIFLNRKHLFNHIIYSMAIIGLARPGFSERFKYELKVLDNRKVLAEFEGPICSNSSQLSIELAKLFPNETKQNIYTKNSNFSISFSIVRKDL